MYEISMETMHMINKIDAETKRRALYNPELRKASVMYRERRNCRREVKRLKMNILDEA